MSSMTSKKTFPVMYPSGDTEHFHGPVIPSLGIWAIFSLLFLTPLYMILFRIFDPSPFMTVLRLVWSLELPPMWYTGLWYPTGARTLSCSVPAQILVSSWLKILLGSLQHSLKTGSSYNLPLVSSNQEWTVSGSTIARPEQSCDVQGVKNN